MRRLSLELLLDHPPADLWEQVKSLTGVRALAEWWLEWGGLDVLLGDGALTILVGSDAEVEQALELLLTLLDNHDGSLHSDYGVALVQRDGELILDEDPDIFWTPRLRELVAKRRAYRLGDLNWSEVSSDKVPFQPCPDDLAGDSNFIESWPPLSPAFVVGGPPLLNRNLPWLYSMEHQHGGSNMVYQALSGAVLRLDDQPGISKFVLGGFEAMEEDPNWRILRKHYPMLEGLTGTNNRHLTAEQLQRLHQFIGLDLKVPPFEKGLEALVECEPCDPWEWFAGWRMVGPGDFRYTAEVHAQLKELFGAELRVYFLWGNCD